MSKTKRLLVVSDFHSGHVIGLTPDKFNPVYNEASERQDYSDARKAYWKFYTDIVDSLRPIDAVIANGDLVDGHGERSGGTELLTTDMNQQVDMAIEVIKYIGCKKIFITRGTAYHTGVAEDFEDNVAVGVGAMKIGDHDYLNVNGLIVDYKHHAGGSSSPMGRFNTIAKERLWNILWSEHDEYPKANLIIRSHVHYYTYCGGYGWMGFTTPALMGYGSKYGTRRVSGTVDFGLLHFDITSKNEVEWRHHILKVAGAAVVPSV